MTSDEPTHEPSGDAAAAGGPTDDGAGDSDAKRTALYEVHVELGGRLTDFAGWMMPLRYGSALDEHHAVRNAAGIFDLSHMAEIDLAGTGAGAALDYALIGQVSKMPVGRARYTMICNVDGTVLDDLIVYRRTDERFLVVANAGNHGVVLAALRDRADGFDVMIVDETDATALIAVQGPASAAIVGQLVGPMASELGYYRGGDARWTSSDVYVARTGYTGEDGFELYIAADQAELLWAAAMDAGSGHGLVPAGLAARDTLRLEAGMALYGHELDLTSTPFDANAGSLIAFSKPDDFVGRASLERLRDKPHAELVGLRVAGKRPAREGYAVLDADTGEDIGVLTSGTLSPTLGYVVAMARLHPGGSTHRLAVDVRGTATDAEIVPLPFYKRPPAPAG